MKLCPRITVHATYFCRLNDEDPNEAVRQAGKEEYEILNLIHIEKWFFEI